MLAMRHATSWIEIEREKEREEEEEGTKNTARKREALEDGIEVKVDIWREERTEETLFYLPDRIAILPIILTDPYIELCSPASPSSLPPFNLLSIITSLFLY